MLPRFTSLAALRLRSMASALIERAPPLRPEALPSSVSFFSSSSPWTKMAARNAALSFAPSSSSSLLKGGISVTPGSSSSSSSPVLLLLPFTRAASSKAAASRAAAAAGLKVYKPTTPGMRGRVITSREGLWKGSPHKQLVGGVGRRGGRNATGQVTVRHRGGGHRTVLRAVDFWRVPAGDSAAAALKNSRATVERLEYDPGRSAHIALVKAIGNGSGNEESENRDDEDDGDDVDDDDDDDDGDDDNDNDESERPRTRRRRTTPRRLPLSGKTGFVTGEGRSYILAPAGLKPGDVVSAGPGSPVSPGCALPLSDIPVGTPVHNVEILPGKGGQLARAAGAAAVVVSRGVPLRSSSSDYSSSSSATSSSPSSSSSSVSAISIDPNSYAIVRLPSGAQRRILARCYATVGTLSNAAHKNRKLGKAGASRWSGKRPHVRGVAMNSVDHPMGGGRGKSKGRISQSPTGVPAKGKKTRDKKSRTDVFVHVERPRGKR